MKPTCFVKGLLLLPFFFASQLSAQQKISIDLGAIRQVTQRHTGINLSSFYHFNEQLLVGMEVNRFFPLHRLEGDEEVILSGWDIEMNMHYLLPLYKKWKGYPIAGISHTSEKEINVYSHQQHFEKYWSMNTGAGVLFEWGKWLPYAEYIFSWGRTNQQFALIGIGYEIEWGKHVPERH